MTSTMQEGKIKSVTIKSDALEELLTGAITHVHKDDTLPALNAVRIWATGGRVYVAATDRYRILEGWKEGEGEIDAVLIRLNDVKRVITLAKGDKRRFALPVTITVTGGLVSVAAGGDSLTLSAWEGSFPPYEHLFPTNDPVAIPAIQFNPLFFSDYGKIAGKGNPVGVRFYGENKPIVIELGENWRALLMPMRRR